MEETTLKYFITASGIVSVLETMAFADITKREHYRCWDHTLRVSHGGWVSYRNAAIQNCQNAQAAYPNHLLEVQTEKY